MHQTFASSSRSVALMVVEGFPPAFKGGGPPVAAANLIAATSDIVDWRVITRNEGSTSSEPIAEDGVWLGKDPWILRTNSYRRMREEANLAMSRWPIRVLVANSLFAPSTRAVGLTWLGRPDVRFVVLPRGELDPGALQLKRVRKAVFIRALKVLKVGARVTLGTTSEIEFGNVRRVFPRSDLVSIPDLPTDPAKVPCRLIPRDRPHRLVFNSRVSEKKGLDAAIRALLVHEHTVELDIFGGDSGSYAAHCRRLASGAPRHVTIRWKGLVPPDELHTRLRDYDAMVLPTLGENFGYAIAESLAAGTPVLLTDSTPWTQSIRGGAGLLLDAPLPAAVSTALSDFEAMSPDAHAAMRRSARAAALAAHADSAQVAQVRQTLRLLIASPTAKQHQGSVEL